MFIKSELLLFDKTYFIILDQNAYTVTLYSKNTGHCWHIVKQIYGKATTFQIYHTHKQGTQYHLHGHAKDIKTVITQIYTHDQFQLSDRKK